MVHHLRNHHPHHQYYYYYYYHYCRKGKGEDEEGHPSSGHLVDGYCGSAAADHKRSSCRPSLLSLLLLSLLSLSFVLASFLLFISFPFPFPFPLYSFGEQGNLNVSQMDANQLLCSSISNGTICCDTSAFRTDICFMKGDVRTHSSSSSIFLYSSSPTAQGKEGLRPQHEKIKPYTRKWETSIMDTIDELNLISKKEAEAEAEADHHYCDVRHDVPAVVFSTGGYTGNIYHEFNDGILPLYITSQHLKKKVVFVILEYHEWWMTKYGDVISRLSDYPPIDFSGDNRSHCFPEAIVGLRIHDELTVDSSLMEGNKSIRDFRKLLDQAYRPRIRDLLSSSVDQAKKEQQKAKKEEEPQLVAAEITGNEEEEEEEEAAAAKKAHNGVVAVVKKKPKLVIMSRTGSRAITNEKWMVKMAEEIGFQVKVVRPSRFTELAKIYRVLNSSDAMVGVHGAAMTHLLFMRPASVFIQVIPLGTEWPAETYYGEPARKLGLKYMGYKIVARESSLHKEYGKDDPVLTDPESVAKRGWEFTKKIYLDHQTVTLDLRRFRKHLVSAHHYISSRHSQLIYS